MSTRQSPEIRINGRRIGAGHPTYIIAEMSANHGQDFAQAVRIIETAKEAGADAVKLQTYTPDTITINCDNDFFKIGKGTIWEGRGLYDLYKDAYTPWEWQPELKKIAEDLGIDFFSTPFDHTAVDFLEELQVSAYKIASFEIVDLPLLRKVASTSKPIIISTGMATLAEIDEAVQTVRKAGNSRIALLKCTSAYPSLPQDMNLRTIPHLADCFQVPVGLSDHTLGETIAVAAVALGACIVEKHLTLSRQDPGPDSAFSMEPQEFKQMVDSIRAAGEAMGTVSYQPTENERASTAFRKSLFVVADMRKGEVFTREKIRSIRPGYGLHTRYYEEILNRKASRDLKRGTPLAWDCVAGD